jgi:hypothetical protein
MTKWLPLLLLPLALSSTTAVAAKPKKTRPPAAATTRGDKAPDRADKAERSEKAEKPEGAPGGDPRLAKEGEVAGRRGPARIEFDDRLVQGQTNKANGVYLFERRESALRSLLKKRTDFHDEIDEMLEDELMR